MPQPHRDVHDTERVAKRQENRAKGLSFFGWCALASGALSLALALTALVLDYRAPGGVSAASTMFGDWTLNSLPFSLAAVGCVLLLARSTGMRTPRTAIVGAVCVTLVLALYAVGFIALLLDPPFR